MSDFEGLLEDLVPGAGRRRAATDIDAPPFPRELGLEPLGIIGKGGSGWVFRARDPVLDREVAVKISRPDRGRTAQQALVAEAQRTARLDHPSVLPVHRLLVAGGMVCVEYRLAPLKTLEAMLSDPADLGDRTIVARLALLRGPVRALKRAHEQGLVHGDVHPGNLVLGEDETVYLLDWAGPGTAEGQLSGSPAHGAPEVLAGDPHGPRADVFSLGVIAWELCAGRPFRPRQRGEELGAFIARWQDQPPPELPAGVVVPAGVPELLAGALARDPDARLDAAGFADQLDAALSGAAERGARAARRDALLGAAREALGRYRELGQRLAEERQVVAIQQARVPGHAPLSAKRALWAAEERLLQVEGERVMLWVDAVERAMLARTVGLDDREAREMVAELWWVRMEDQAARGQDREVRLAMHHILQSDPDNRGAVLRLPCHLDVRVEGVEEAEVTIARLVERGRVLKPEPVDTCPAPVAGVALPAGSYLVTARAPDREPVTASLSLSRAEPLSLILRPRTAAQVGHGWVLVPAGAFQLGGDLHARDPLPRCRPTLGDLYVRRFPVIVAEYAAFLAGLPREEAERRLPGRRGAVGAGETWWALDAAGVPVVPPDWHLRWAVVGIDADDAAAYAAWVSAETGRPVRLPTEDEWEKAARGADGRAYPWGHRFDPTFAHMRDSRPGPPGPAAVDAAPIDVSPYGVRGAAGGVREWTASWLDGGRVVVRGGSWADGPEELRCASRRGLPADWRSDRVGFRLVSDVPAPI